MDRSEIRLISSGRGNKPPITLVWQVYMPEIVGDFDHLIVDTKRKHLLVTDEVNHSV